MKRLIIFLLLFAAIKVAGQTTGYLRFDTVRITKQNGTCELYIINKTKDSLGLLTNVGGGLTRFIKSRANGDTIFVGLDTLVMEASAGNANVGTGYRILKPGTQEIKTLHSDITGTWDSTSNADGLTYKADTIIMATRGRLYKVADSLIAMITAAGGMNELTGDVAAGPGTGSQVATIQTDAITTTKIINDAVTNAKMANMTGPSVKGKSASGAGDPEDIAASTNNRVFKRNASGVLAFEQITNDDVNDIDYGKLTNTPPQVPGISFGPAQAYDQSFTVKLVAILRVNGSWSNGATIPWELLATADHTYSVFDSVYGSSINSRLIVRYPAMKQLLGFGTWGDEVFASACVFHGPSGGLTTLEFPVYRNIPLGITLRGAGTNTWAEVSGTGLQGFFDQGTISGTTGVAGLNVAVPAGSNVWGTDYNAINFIYSGPNNYHIKRAYSGLGIYNIGFSLRDEFDNPVILPTSTDEVTVSNAGLAPQLVNMRTFNSTNTFLTNLANFNVEAWGEAWIIANGISSTSVQVRWQTNYPSATAYKIYRKTSQYGAATLIYSGTGGDITDIGLTTATLYFYDMYAVVGGVDTFVSYFRTNTK